MKLESDPQNKKIVMRGVIGDYVDAISANDFHDILAEHAGQDITIELDSEGGSVFDGLSIYNALMNHQGKVTIHVDTLAASIATVICCAADEVVMNSNAQFMIHRCWTVAMGNCKDLSGQAKIMEKLDEQMAAVYASRSGLEKDAVLGMMDSETWLDASEALDSGFIDRIHETSRPKAEEKPKILALGPNAFAAKAKALAARTRLRLR